MMQTDTAILCRSCGSPTGSTHRGRKYCPPCRRDRAAVVKARWHDESAPVPGVAPNRPVPSEWRVSDAPLTAVDVRLRDEVGSSECYTCQYFRLCRRNVADAGFRLPCFQER